MSSSIENCCYSSLVLAHVLAQATLVFSLMLTWIFFPWNSWWPTSDHHDHAASRAQPSTACHSIAAQAVRDSLHVLTYGELIDEEQEPTTTPFTGADTTCAVCLSELRRRDRVRELKNCRHVFHKGCLDRWLDHNEHLTCPLCRAPLLGDLPLLPCSAASAPPPGAAATEEPSWAVERLLYLFGDDLIIFASSSSYS